MGAKRSKRQFADPPGDGEGGAAAPDEDADRATPEAHARASRSAPRVCCWVCSSPAHSAPFGATRRRNRGAAPDRPLPRQTRPNAHQGAGKGI
jgi:hypothetical protein